MFVWLCLYFISSELSTNAQLQTILLKTILKVATTYRTVLMANAFPSSLKNPLLQLSVVNTPTTRIIVQQILHTLIDRHDNIEKFSKIWYVHHGQAIKLFQLIMNKWLRHRMCYHMFEPILISGFIWDNLSMF